MSNETAKYLLPEEDGLMTRSNKPHAIYKLFVLQRYLEIADVAMARQKWRARYFIDLQAGPGKNDVEGKGIMLGSPLIALRSPRPADQFRFNEKSSDTYAALAKRTSYSPLRERIKLYQQDVNEVVDEICAEIKQVESQSQPTDKWGSTFNIAFLDPEGLELEWRTVEKLARMKKMDLIINFSTSGVLRASGRGNIDAIDRFFGTSEWRNILNATQSAGDKRRTLIEFYLNRLKSFGYYVQIDPDLYHHDNVIQVTNRNNAEIYSMIFASKNELGDKFWRQSAKNTKPPRLPGF